MPRKRFDWKIFFHYTPTTNPASQFQEPPIIRAKGLSCLPNRALPGLEGKKIGEQGGWLQKKKNWNICVVLLFNIDSSLVGPCQESDCRYVQTRTYFVTPTEFSPLQSLLTGWTRLLRYFRKKKKKKGTPLEQIANTRWYSRKNAIFFERYDYIKIENLNLVAWNRCKFIFSNITNSEVKLKTSV